MGEARPDLGYGVRVFSFGNYAVYFRKTGARLVIARVVHGARNVNELEPPKAE